ncbi:MAG: hypothetical protein PVG14_16220 [Anaerolineales bacterium]|jgi:hypothetical protein
MKFDPIQELRALLFGEGPYERPIAPDLITLVGLAPILEDEMLLQVLEDLSHMGGGPPHELYRTLVILLGYFPESGGEEILGTLVQKDPQFTQLLPEALIPRAVEGLRAIETHIGYRAEAILALAARLPQERGETLLIEEALSAAREPSWAYTRRRAIIDLVGGMDAPLAQEAAQELLDTVRDLEDSNYRLRGLAALAPVLPQPMQDQVLPELLETIREQEDPSLRAETLIVLGSRLSGTRRRDLLEEAFQAARTIDLQASKRHELLVRLSLHFSRTTRLQILEEADRPYEEGIYVWPSATEALVQALGRLALRLPDHLKETFQAQVQSLELPLEFDAYQPLLPYLSKVQLWDALKTIPALDWEELMAEALISLAPHLPKDLMSDALEMVSGWDEEKAKAQALLALVPKLPPDLIREVVEIAKGIENEYWRGWIVEALKELPGLDEEYYLILRTPPLGERLRQLWAPLPTSVQQTLLTEVIDGLWSYYGGSEAAMDEDTGAYAPPSPDDELIRREEASETSAEEWFGEERGFGFYVPEDNEAEAEEWESEEAFAFFDEDEETLGEEWEDVQAEMAPEEIEPEELLARASTPDWERKPVVNTGFAPQEKPDEEIRRLRPLVQDHEYYFWINIGEQKETSIAADSPVLDVSKLPPEAHLKVVLYGFPGEIEITSGADVGEVKILSNRRTVVTQAVVEPQNLEDQTKLEDHLYFPVKTPAVSGDFRLRCNLYYQAVLLQSHLITARVVSEDDLPPPGEFDLSEGPPLRHTLDYKLTNTLRTEVITDLEKHSLSILLNDDGDGTHGFRFFGGEDGSLVKEQASFTGLELQNMIDQARGALRKAAWDSKDEWQPPARYRYETKPADGWLERLLGDLVRFAKWGTRFYRQTLQKIAEAHAQNLDEADHRKAQLESKLRFSGMLQIAAKEDSRHILPAALIYDYPIHDALPSEMYKLCEGFLDALENGDSLKDTPCFQGNCPTRDDLTKVCPSGFWGYRHIIGMPVSIGDENAETDLKIIYSDNPQISVAVSMDEDFKLRAGHIDALRELRAGSIWKLGDEGQEILDLLRAEGSHLVYFYCHGGLTDDGVPYLQVGPEDDIWGTITPSLLPNLQIKWHKPKPLVFINGCHTTALEPAKALDLVTSFVKEVRAVGVIGTEITIFEPLATAFAETCLGHFLDGVPIGEAIRLARLKLLQDGNPLGLVYIPFTVSSLALIKESHNDD